MTNTLQYYAQSIALDEYVLKMPLDIQIGSLGAEKFNFEIHDNTHWKKCLFFPVCLLRRKLDFGSAELCTEFRNSVQNWLNCSKSRSESRDVFSMSGTICIPAGALWRGPWAEISTPACTSRKERIFLRPH